MTSLKKFLSLLKDKNEVVEVSCPVKACFEIPEIHRRVIASGGPALLFTNVVGSSFPVVTNLFGSNSRVDLAFSSFQPESLFQTVDFFLNKPCSIRSLWNNRRILSRLFQLGLKKKRFSHYLKVKEVDLNALPFLTSWPYDGGAFLTLPLVYTESPLTGIANLGMYRMQRFDSCNMGLHFQIQKGGGMHFYESEQLQKDLPVNVFLGGSPFLILSAIAPLPEKISELLLCSFLMGRKLPYTSSKYNSYPVLSNCEFVFFGKALQGIRQPEGPFGDHYGYYSLKHDFPVFKCLEIYHAKDAIFPATVVGKPKQEDFYLGEKLQNFLAPLISMVMPSVVQLKSYGESGFHCLSAAIVKERYEKESLTCALRILGEGQLSLTKFLLITNNSVNLNNFKEVLSTILARFSPTEDLIILSHSSQDTLDYTGPGLNLGSKAILMGLNSPKRDLKATYQGSLPEQVKKIAVFCPGCLVIEIKDDLHFQDLYDFPEFQSWPLIIVVNNLEKTIKNETSFIWRVFTRFEPAADIFFKETTCQRNRPKRTLPIIIDSRMKLWYPEEVSVDKCTKDLVSRKWSSYFPCNTVKQGDYDDI